MSLELIYLLTVFVVALIAGAGWELGKRIVAALWKKMATQK